MNGLLGGWRRGRATGWVIEWVFGDRWRRMRVIGCEGDGQMGRSLEREYRR